MNQPQISGSLKFYLATLGNFEPKVLEIELDIKKLSPCVRQAILVTYPIPETVQFVFIASCPLLDEKYDFYGSAIFNELELEEEKYLYDFLNDCIRVNIFEGIKDLKSLNQVPVD